MRKLSDLKEAPEHLEVKREISKRVVANKVCKDDHSTLVAYGHPSNRDLEIIACSECWIKCPGFISKVSMERIKSKAHFERKEIEANYPEYFGKDDDRDVDDVIEDILDQHTR